MSRVSRAKLLQWTEGFRISFYDPGVTDDELQGDLTVPEPRQIYENATQWMGSSRSKILCIQAPPYRGSEWLVPRELLQRLRFPVSLPCVWFFGGARSYQGLTGQEVTPQAKMLSLVSTMITQLIKLVPHTVGNTRGTFSRTNIMKMQEPDENSPGIPISIPKAIDLIKALAKVAPPNLFFVFHRCDGLASVNGAPDRTVTRQFSDLLRYLAEGQPFRQWKILWVGTCTSRYLRMMRGTVESDQFVFVEYPTDFRP
ncbi:hypothetical protein F4677DRAFT_465878 [Hypoxylon crocopeplum]|nr:hypothetical protein F4677DRAFT_465878 [Hypoxylon crocopeplum]